MHGKNTTEPRKTAYLSPSRMVAILHSTLPEDLSREGFGLAEVMVAVLVLCVGLLGVASFAYSSRRLAELAATRTAQTIAAHRVLDAVGPAGSSSRPDTVEVGDRRLAVWLDTLHIGERLVELRLTVAGRAAAGDLEVVTRRLAAP